MSDHSATFEVTITSPHGKAAIEEFRKWLGKVGSEASERWGITLQIERKDPDTEHSTEFN